MPVFVVPNSNGEDNAPVLREFNPCHQPGGRPDGGQFAPKGQGNCEGGEAGGAETDPAARAHAVEARLKSAAEVQRRSNPQMTAAEKADPAFQRHVTKVQNEAETLLERQQAIPIARAYYESAKGMEGYPDVQADGSPGGSLMKHAGPINGLTAERSALHDRITAHFVRQFTAPVEKPTVIVTGGLPGAGKSVGLRSIPEAQRYLNVNSDDIKMMLPEYNGTNAAFLHEESDKLASQIFRLAVEARQNLVLDVTMKSLGEASKGITDGLAGRIRAMAERGYTVRLQFTEVSMDTSVRQVLTRYFETGRFVPPSYVRSARAKGQTASSKNYETFLTLRKLPQVQSWAHYTREFGSGAVLYDKGGT